MFGTGAVEALETAVKEFVPIPVKFKKIIARMLLLLMRIDVTAYGRMHIKFYDNCAFSFIHADMYSVLNIIISYFSGLLLQLSAALFMLVQLH